MALATPALLQGVDLHYETENRVLRNEQERRNEERELVYEISWIPELSTVASLFAVITEQISIGADRAASVAAMS